MQQEIENLRPDGHDFRAMGKLPALGVEHVVSEHELHLGTPVPNATAARRGNWRLSSSIHGTAAQGGRSRPDRPAPGRKTKLS
jgi:hypothetical protein